MAWVATDSFDTYSNGDLNGANGGSGWSGAWSGDTSYDVQSTTFYDGTKAVTCAGVNVDMVRSLTTPVTAGIVKVALRSTQFANNVGGFVLRDGGANRIRVTLEAGAIRLQNGAQSVSADIVASASANTWYEIHVEIDAANDRARARLVGDAAWGSWITVEAFTDIDEVRVTTASDTSGSMLFDTIGVGSDPVVATLTINVSDSLTISESITMLITSSINVNDALTITESVTMERVSFINVFDAITITESVTVTNTTLGPIDVNDTITLTESVTITNTTLGPINVNDTVTITESIATETVNTISVSDTITISESVTVENTQLGPIDVNDTVTISEDVTVDNGQLGGISVSDTITIEEAVTMTMDLGDIFVSDSVTISESIQTDVTLNLSVSDTVTITESVSVFNPEAPKGITWMRSKEDAYPLGMDWNNPRIVDERSQEDQYPLGMDDKTII